jgi:hypothetical protein
LFDRIELPFFYTASEYRLTNGSEGVAVAPGGVSFLRRAVHTLVIGIRVIGQSLDVEYDQPGSPFEPHRGNGLAEGFECRDRVPPVNVGDRESEKVLRGARPVRQ